MGFTVFGAALLCLAVVWSTIKPAYRQYANDGASQQIVVIGYSDRMVEISRLVSELNYEKLAKGADVLVRRVMYYEFFGAAVSFVPSSLDYSKGAIWGEALTRSFTPRILFPDKRAINDSDITNQYTGLSLTSADQGTSISMGMMAEAYIDFGPEFMFFLITSLGAFLGYIYRRLLTLQDNRNVIGAALSTIVIMPAFQTETSILKLIPALAVCVLAAYFILKFIVPRMFGLENGQRRRQRFAPSRR